MLFREGVPPTMREVEVIINMLLFKETYSATADGTVTVSVVDRKASLMVPILTPE